MFTNRVDVVGTERSATRSAWRLSLSNNGVRDDGGNASRDAEEKDTYV